MNNGVKVAIAASDANQKEEIQYSGNPVFVDIVRDVLYYEAGVYGHTIGNTTTPIDLYSAMSKEGMKQFKPKLIEGLAIVENWKPNLPPNVKS